MTLIIANKKATQWVAVLFGGAGGIEPPSKVI
jgi:hypothetical protein